MKTKKSNPVVKRTISLSPLVNQWAEEMAAAQGFESNFSSFLADLVRRAGSFRQLAGRPLHRERLGP